MLGQSQQASITLGQSPLGQGGRGLAGLGVSRVRDHTQSGLSRIRCQRSR